MIHTRPGMVTIRIKPGAEWRGAKYFAPAYYDLTPEYARHVVETLGVADYLTEEEMNNQTEITGAELTRPRDLTVKFKTDKKYEFRQPSLEQCARAYRASIEEHDLGVSQCGLCYVYEGSKKIANVSYNGRVWEA